MCEIVFIILQMSADLLANLCNREPSVHILKQMSPEIDNVTEWLRTVQLYNRMERLAELPPGGRVEDGTHVLFFIFSELSYNVPTFF
jgi:hypothetical protein